MGQAAAPGPDGRSRRRTHLARAGLVALGAGVALGFGSGAAVAAPEPLDAIDIGGPWWGTGAPYQLEYEGDAQPLWSGGSLTIGPDAQAPGEPSSVQVARAVTASLSGSPVPCAEAVPTVTVTVNATNNGPNPGFSGNGALTLAGSHDGVPALAATGFSSTPVGATVPLHVSSVVDPADLVSGELAVQLWVETFHSNGPKGWTLSDFTASVELDTSACEPAVVVDDSGSTVVDTPSTIDVVGNDTIPDGSTGWNVDTTTTNGGTVVDNGDGTVTYTPPSGFTGTDTFTYRVAGPDGVEVEATVTVTVTEDENGVPLVAPGAAAVTGLLGLAGFGARTLRRKESQRDGAA